MLTVWSMNPEADVSQCSATWSHMHSSQWGGEGLVLCFTVCSKSSQWITGAIFRYVHSRLSRLQKIKIQSMNKGMREWREKGRESGKQRRGRERGGDREWGREREWETERGREREWETEKGREGEWETEKGGGEWVGDREGGGRQSGRQRGGRETAWETERGEGGRGGDREGGGRESGGEKGRKREGEERDTCSPFRRGWSRCDRPPHTQACRRADRCTQWASRHTCRREPSPLLWTQAQQFTHGLVHLALVARATSRVA